MAPKSLFYRTLDVFTNQRFKGNQLSVVEVGDAVLSPTHMQMIAREFNFSETVFLRRGADGELAINIFTPENEMEFAGHPVIGTGHVIFGRLLPTFKNDETSSTARLLTKAGPVVLQHDPATGIVAAEVPHNIHIHSQPTTLQQLVVTQPALNKDMPSLQSGFPAVSIVKGVTYTLVDFTSHPDLFASVSSGPSQSTTLDHGWSPSFTGVMYYMKASPDIKDGITLQKLRVRMIAINLEDPACGSGSCSLSAYLALQQGGPGAKFRFLIDQGREIGRDSNIQVDITLNDSGSEVASIFLAGPATPVTEGTLLLPE